MYLLCSCCLVLLFIVWHCVWTVVVTSFYNLFCLFSFFVAKFLHHPHKQTVFPLMDCRCSSLAPLICFEGSWYPHGACQRAPNLLQNNSGTAMTVAPLVVWLWWRQPKQGSLFPPCVFTRSGFRLLVDGSNEGLGLCCAAVSHDCRSKTPSPPQYLLRPEPLASLAIAFL